MAERGGAVAALAARFREGTPLVSAWCGIAEPAVAGLLAAEPGFDTVTLDMQHGAHDFDSIARTVPLVAARGKPTIARVPVGAFSTVSRLFDAGVSAVIAPMVNSAEDARQFAAFAKYPPLGARSWGPLPALALSGLPADSYLREANGFCLSLAMVETREALDAVDAILAVEGIDGIFIGPSDLSIALSGGAGLDPGGSVVRAALDHARARARAAGKRIGVYAHSAARARENVQEGFDLIALMGDAGLLRLGAQAALKEVRG
ncbi:HpcH/HpaI aldolase family protein [Methylobacterium nodulans]|uniref:HpcH/HpaI aldolase n=1 Tax=Methylobacterium nodulans (strain LMG 21967 / CNCM I-2342 / ORS 2060) TaxID=460265 RepID=B8IS22_METNO|nr:aldolase/citrate lyase family protein [Methylobacterium nodulans]ACL56834.1 HpcH/HpaI aldolase [Methylobacterium nodulans ORS 2060]